ncbi:hypothetical protein [Corynebacterium sp. A21]|uniref:hypothetical protein n=1 Tax=Corynebacterium sp. A21 TaxID=3457318 RepID=UPI003FD1D27B
MKRVLAAVSMAIAVTLSASACAAEAPILPGGASATTEAAEIEVNTADLEFVIKVKPLLQNSVEIGRLILAEPDLNPEVRLIAENSVARAQDEVIQLNAMLEEWEFATGDLRPHAENAIDATAAIDPSGSQNLVGGLDDARILQDSPAGQQEITYLLLLRQQLSESIMLAENSIELGESSGLRVISEQIVAVKAGRIAKIDGYLQHIEVEPRELR